MGNHPFNVIVVLFWLVTMGWLVVAKVLPPLRQGEPPNYASILSATHKAELPTCWSIRLRDRTIGWAANKTVRRKDGITELHSRVYLSEFPLEEMAPAWVGTVLKGVFEQFAHMDLDKRSCLTLDPLGRLDTFESRVRVGPMVDVIKVQGQIDGTSLKLSMQSGDLAYKFDRYMPANSLMSDELSPQVRMPGLRVGQAWTVPVYSPFRAPTSPIEILQATVEREEKITWDGETVTTRVIYYRGDAGAALADNAPRGRTWVRDDGLVLHQEVSILNSHMHFERLGERTSEEIRETLGEEWNQPLKAAVAKRLLRSLVSEAP